MYKIPKIHLPSSWLGSQILFAVAVVAFVGAFSFVMLDPLNLFSRATFKELVINNKPENLAEVVVTRMDFRHRIFKKDSVWLVESVNGDVRADGEKVGGFVAELFSLKRDYLVSNTTASYRQLQLDEETGMSVVLSFNDGSEANIIVGKKRTDDSGIFFRLPGDDKVYESRGAYSSLINLPDTRDLTLAQFKGEPIKEFSAFQGETLTLKVIQREDLTWWVETPVKVDIVDSISSKFLAATGTIAAIDVYAAIPENSGLDKPKEKILLKNHTKEVAILIGSPRLASGDLAAGVYAQIEGDTQAFLLDPESIKNIPVTLSELNQLRTD